MKEFKFLLYSLILCTFLVTTSCELFTNSLATNLARDEADLLSEYSASEILSTDNADSSAVLAQSAKTLNNVGVDIESKFEDFDIEETPTNEIVSILTDDSTLSEEETAEIEENLTTAINALKVVSDDTDNVSLLGDLLTLDDLFDLID
ncbi:MAG: hypothetical protein BKP49_00820 [Treponema sp. CETP13]|nr:MAG: hypothetical protein BKP49_00820 [Treponema sp. CETP13]